MSDKGHEHSMRIERVENQNFLIRVSMELPSEETRWIPQGQYPSLAMDPSRPSNVGWRWSPPREAGDEARPATLRLHTQSDPDHRSINFSYSLYKENTCTLALADEVDAFLPVGESSYSTAVEIDPITRTIWFPLPVGRSIHKLEYLFNFYRASLDRLIEKWFSDKDEETPLPFVVTPDGHYDEEACCQHCFSKTTEAMESVDIPAELLRDPIRNGSEYLEHGFNPWNQDQKARITAHLERELVRLTDFFQQDAASHVSEVLTADQSPSGS